MRGKHADADTNSISLNNIIYFYVLQEILQCGRSFEVVKILSDERYQILKVSRWATCLLSPNRCENDLHSPENIGPFKTLNPNPSWEEPVVSEHVVLITFLPCFLPAVHKCVWGWTQDGGEVVQKRAALVQRHSGGAQHSAKPDATKWYIDSSPPSPCCSINYRLNTPVSL